MKTSLPFRFFILAPAVLAGVVCAQEAATGDAAADAGAAAVELPALSVYSSRVALQEPVAAFAMPVSALAFEPLVDVQARNMGEAQADVAIRGGIFETTGFRAGAVALYDPQTGHYSAEIPAAPAMLSAPTVLTGADNALGGWNANAGTVAYEWRRVRAGGVASAGAGGGHLRRAEVYQGWVSPAGVRGRRLAADAAGAWSDSDGSRPFGESRFHRYNARLQLAGDGGQTDLFYGWQSKFISWPNLYTPYNVIESDDLRTELLVLNHREELGGGDFVAAGAYWRRNVDHYVYDRTGATPGPSNHTTWVRGAGAEGRLTTGAFAWNFSANFIADKLESDTLTWGRFNTRNHTRASLAPETSWTPAGARKLTVLAGAVFDDTNRDAPAVSPVARLALANAAPGALADEFYVSHAASSQVATYTALNSRPSAGLFRGDPDLGREKARNTELGLKGARGNWAWTAAVFHRSERGLVDWIYSTSLPNARVASAVDIDTTGIELVARYAGRRLDLVLGYTGLRKDADYGNASAGASFYALNFPVHRLTAAVTVRAGRGWEIRLDNEARRQKPNALRVTGDDAVLSAVEVSYTPPRQPALRLTVTVDNLWDSDFQDVPAVPAARRQWVAGAALAW
jgi:hypothetical protein